MSINSCSPENSLRPYRLSNLIISACEYAAPTTRPGSRADCFLGDGSRRPSAVRVRQKGEEDLAFQVSEQLAVSPPCTPLHLSPCTSSQSKSRNILRSFYGKYGASACVQRHNWEESQGIYSRILGGGFELTNLDHLLQDTISLVRHLLNFEGVD